MKGRRTPTKIKKLQGSFNAARELKNPISFAGIDGLPNPPEMLQKFGRELWTMHGKRLAEVGLLSDVNLWALEGFCVSFEIAHDKSKEMRSDAKAFRMWRDAMDKASQFGAKFGFDPQSATKIGFPEKQKGQKRDPFEDAVEGPTLKISKG
jgi:phage terminase small subunit